MAQISQSAKCPPLLHGIRTFCIILISVALCACLRRPPLEWESPLMIRVQGEGMLTPTELQTLAKQTESAHFRFFSGNPGPSETLSNSRPFSWASDHLEAIVVHPIDQNAAPFPERLLAARLAARDAAWKEMGNALQGLPVGDTLKTLGEEIAASPDLRRQVEENIRGAEIDEKEEAGSSHTLCIARLQLNTLASLLAPEQKDGLTSGLPSRNNTPYPRNLIENASFAKALAQARAMLQTKVMELPLSKKQTMGNLLATNPEAQNEARKAFESARIDVMDFPRQGECIIRLSLDATRLIDALRALEPK